MPRSLILTTIVCVFFLLVTFVPMTKCVLVCCFAVSCSLVSRTHGQSCTTLKDIHNTFNQSSVLYSHPPLSCSSSRVRLQQGRPYFIFNSFVCLILHKNGIQCIRSNLTKSLLPFFFQGWSGRKNFGGKQERDTCRHAIDPPHPRSDLFSVSFLSVSPLFPTRTVEPDSALVHVPCIVICEQQTVTR